MLQKYKILLFHINLFAESIDAKKSDLYLQEMYYRNTLDYLFSKYNLCLIGNEQQKSDIISKNIGINKYFEYFYNTASFMITPQEYYKIMRELYCSDYTKYLVIGNNTNEEINEASKLGISTCMITDYYTIPSSNVTALEKIKKIL